METYVNSPTERTNTGERTEIGRAGELKIYTVVGISFGLLCIIQVVVNVSLHRHGAGFSNRSNNNSTCNFTLIEPQSLEKDQLLRDNEKLNREKNQLSNENAKLIEENMMLKKNITDQRNQISEPQEMNVRCCPPGWMAYKSSCYRLSPWINTWDYAEQDCLRMGANLVILNSQMEEQVVRSFARGEPVWIGLRGQQGTFTWVDGRPPPYDYYLHPDYENEPDSCAYVDDHHEPRLKVWFKTNCEHDFYWICEKKL